MPIPALHGALVAGRGLWTLYLIEDDNNCFDLGLRNHHEWLRSAVVTEQHWLANATRLFAWMIPGEARVYPTAEIDAAKAWVAGSGEPGAAATDNQR